MNRTHLLAAGALLLATAITLGPTQGLTQAQTLPDGRVAAVDRSPTLLTPVNGTVMTKMEPIALRWEQVPGGTQYHVQFTPFNNDGPGVNLILDATDRLTIAAPVLGTGPYLLLPGMTYTWRVRATDLATAAGENDPNWGPWSTLNMVTTPPPSAAGVKATQPAERTTVTNFTPVLQWSDPDPADFYYEVQLSTDSQFRTDPGTAVASVYTNLVHGGQAQPLNSWMVPAAFPLQPSATYSWRVRPRVQGRGVPVAWSPVFSFTTPAVATAPVATPTPLPTASPTPAPTAPTPVATPSPVAATPVLLATNLLVNGDAELGDGSSDGQVVPIPGWKVTGNLTSVRYGAFGGFIQLADPGPANRGRNYFVGGPESPVSTANQQINVAGNAADIDAGRLNYLATGYFGGFDGQDDRASLALTFRDADGNNLRSVTIGNVNSSDRNGNNGLQGRTLTEQVPAGTRIVQVVLTMQRLVGPYNDAAADNLTFMLTAR